MKKIVRRDKIYRSHISHSDYVHNVIVTNTNIWAYMYKYIIHFRYFGNWNCEEGLRKSK